MVSGRALWKPKLCILTYTLPQHTWSKEGGVLLAQESFREEAGKGWEGSS